MVGKTLQTNLSKDLFSSIPTTKESNDVSSSSGKSFSTLMNQNLGSKYKDVDNTLSHNLDNTTKKSDTSSTKKSDYQKDTKDYDYQKDEVSVKKPSKVEKNDSDKSVSSQTVKSTDEKKNVSNSDIDAKVSQLEDDLKETVKEVLGLTDEQYADLMAQLGLTTLDLLQPDNLKALTLAANNTTDITAILTDENMAKQLNSLLEKVGNINSEEDYGITKDQLQSILENMNEKTSSEVDESPEKDIKKVVQNQNIEDNKVGSEDKQLTIQVLKEEKDIKETDSTSTKTASELNTSTEEKASDMGQSGQSDDSNKQNNNTNLNTNPLDILVNNLVGGVNQTNSFVDQVSKVTQMREIVNQIVEQIKINIKLDSTSMELQLNPENLGKVNLTVTQKNGMMTAQFLVENQAVKEAIESQMSLLKENLENQGLKVEEVEVTVSNFGFSQNNGASSESEEGKGTNKRKVNFDVLDMEDDESVEEAEEDTLLNDGGSINYIA